MMKRKYLRRIMPALACMLVLIVCGCRNSEWKYRPITDVNNLEGRRVAVNLAWEADYYLSGRKDMTLVQYDTFADMIMALEYNKVDVFALDDLSWKLFQVNSTGLARVEPAFGIVGYEIYFSGKRERLKDEFNAFLEEYRKTEAYEDHMARLYDFDGLNYEDPVPELTGTGEILNVAVLAEQFPRAYIDPDEDIPTGFDLEALKMFANEKNYRLNFYLTVYNDMLVGMRTGLYDIGVGYLGDVYEAEVLESGLFVSTLLDEMPLYFIEKTQKELSVNLDNLE